MGNPRPTLQVAQEHEKRGDLPKAAKAYAQHLAKETGDVRIMLRLAEIRERLGDEAGAADLFNRVGAVHHREGFSQKAIAAFRRAATIDPRNLEHTFQLARILIDADRQKDAANVIDGIRGAVLRTTASDRTEKLERLAQMDHHLDTVLALSEALGVAGRRAEAIQRLEEARERMRAADTEPQDRLVLLERLLLLRPDDKALALEAARMSLAIGQPKAALAFTRGSLERHRDDPDLLRVAASAVDGMGDVDRGALLHREAARRLTLAGRLEEAKKEWGAVLEADDSNFEARSSIRPIALPPSILDEAELPSPEEILSMAPDPDTLARLSIGLELDQEPSTPSIPTPVRAPAPLPAVLPAAIARAPIAMDRLPVIVASRQTLVPRAAHEVADTTPLVLRRALLISDGPEAGWLSRGLADLDIEVTSASSRHIELGPAAAARSSPQLVVAPSEFAEDWRKMGSWRVASLIAFPRRIVRARAGASGIPIVESEPAESATRFIGGPFDLVGPFGPPIPVRDPRARPLFITRARATLGPEIEIQPTCESHARVLVAADRTSVAILGEWMERESNGNIVFESPAGDGEAERATLAKSAARALGLRGLAVLVLAHDRGAWKLESMDRSFGPGAVAAEVRTGRSIAEVLVDLAQGGAPPSAIDPRGFAICAEVAMSRLASVANLRIEPDAEGETAYVCAHAADRAQAERRLARVLL